MQGHEESGRFTSGTGDVDAVLLEIDSCAAKYGEPEDADSGRRQQRSENKFADGPAEGIPEKRIYVDKKSGSTTNRVGLNTALDYARDGDIIVVHTLDRLGRTVRDTLNMIHDLAERGIGVRNLADPIRVDSAKPEDPMAQLALVMLALFGQMERTYAIERAAHARSVATSEGKRVGRPSVVDPSKLAYAAHLLDTGLSIPEIVDKTGITRSSLYRHLPPRPPESVMADDSSTSIRAEHS
ncbi:recombinase family protein [Arthrobacter sp. H14]|uniref:recombinase family protein n=1 Tax=Arthrobacter sp. H14 TaxID=1312959 RepID=UPI0004B5439B|nr:recombinase family protein [Arthrobacter sp. H14]